MIPPVLTRPISLQPSILNREHIRKHALLVHRHPEQLPAIAGSRAQLLAGRVHRLLLALQVEEVLAALLRLVELPGAVDGPVAQETGAGETEGARG